MSKVRVIYNPNKSVSIIHPALKSKRDDETETNWLDRIFSKVTPEGAIYDDIDSSELPQDRDDRTAWEGEKSKGVNINQEKVQKNKEDKMNKIKIDGYIKQKAIDHLKASGELPDDYEFKKEKIDLIGE